MIFHHIGEPGRSARSTKEQGLRQHGLHSGRCLQGAVCSSRMGAMVSSHLGLITKKTKGKKGLKLLLFGPMIGCVLGS